MTTPTNRPASLHAYLSYRDAHAARAWLVADRQGIGGER